MKAEPAKESGDQCSRRVLQNVSNLGSSVIDMDTEGTVPTKVDSTSLEGYQRSEESPENVMPLKPVANWKCIIHHQVLKIREEDSNLGEDIAEGLKEKLAIQNLTSQMDRFMIARPILPCSPLSGKTAVLH